MGNEKFDFFVSVPPGFENLVLRELQKFYSNYSDSFYMAPPEDWSLHKGGVELNCSVEAGCLLNYELKTANRVLMRIYKGPCKTLNDLQDALTKSKLLEIIGSSGFEASVSYRSSKLNHEKKIKSAVSQWRKKALGKESLEKENLQRIDIRIFRDEVTISLDASGERLHKRGWRKKSPKAPIRENLASGMLMTLFSYIHNDDGKNVQLIDPMMGSGTLLKEASDYFQPNLQREYSFERWPNIPNLKKSLKANSNEFKVDEFFGSEIDKSTFGLLEKNGIPNRSEKSHWRLFQGDFRDMPFEINDSHRLLICNLPYGDRVKRKGGVAPEKLLEILIKKYQPTRMGLLAKIDNRNRVDHNLPENWQILHTIYFENGGIPVVYKVYGQNHSFLDL